MIIDIGLSSEIVNAAADGDPFLHANIEAVGKKKSHKQKRYCYNKHTRTIQSCSMCLGVA